MAITQNNAAQVLSTAVPLAIAGAVGAEVISRIAGNDIANSIGGNSITSELIETRIMLRILRNIKARKEAK